MMHRDASRSPDSTGRSAWSTFRLVEYRAAAVRSCLSAADRLLLGMRSLNGLGPVRKWVAIGIRLAVLLLFVLILGGVRWQRQHKDLEVMVLRDISESTAPGQELPRPRRSRQSLDDYLSDAHQGPDARSPTTASA